LCAIYYNLIIWRLKKNEVDNKEIE
jgi:hypothetical protein